MRRENSEFRWISLAIWVLAFLTGHSHAQSPGFTASVSSQKVVQNMVFDIRFELSDAEGSNFQPPSFGEFKLVGGPSRGSSTTIINGVVSRSESWSYSLLATKTGKFTIGPATVVAGRKRLSTDPIHIEVIAAKDIARSGTTGKGEGVLLVAEVENKNFYPGQQIILNYRLLFRESIQTVNILSEDDYMDFFVQNFGDFSKEPSLVRVNGVEYTSRIIKSMALFPHQSGDYTLDPMIMDVGINAPFPGIQGFFTMHRIQDVRVASEPLTLKILPLPDGAPSTFNGAVGHYELKTSGGQHQISTDDALTFQIEIRGNGDSKRWDPPMPQTDTIFDVFDPKIIEDKVEEHNGMVVHTRTLEYQLLPRSTGQFKVTVPFTYFDPHQKAYSTITSDTLTVNVLQGTLAGHQDEATADKAPKEILMPVRSPLLADRFWTSWPHLLLFGLIVSGTLFNVVLTARRRKENRIPEAQRVKNASGRNAMKQLDALQAEIPALPSKEFYEKATEILHRFLTERLGIPPAELDTTRLPVFLRQTGIADADTKKVMDFFEQSLVVRYGGIPAEYSPDQMITSCREIVQLF